MEKSPDQIDHQIDQKSEFALKVKPRPVTRINRKLLIGVFMGTVAVILMATLYGLVPTDYGSQTKGPELYNVGQKPSAESLNVLPKTYQDMPKRPIELGPAMMGDMGDAIVKAESQAGITAQAPASTAKLPFRPDAETDAIRAERIRQAQAAIRAKESKVFFELNDAQAKTPAVQDMPAIKGMTQEEPISPYQLMAGTIISASLITGINSDLPGVVMAQVTENIYDTVTGHTLLVPQGARLMGRYDSQIAQGQKRAMIIWQRLLMPNGSHITLDNMTASDQAGYSGLTDGVDFHTGDLMKGIALSTLLGVGTELAIGDDQNSLLRALTDSTQRTANKAGQAIVEQYLNRKPTLTIRPGWKLKVIVHKDLTLKPYLEESQ